MAWCVLYISLGRSLGNRGPIYIFLYNNYNLLQITLRVCQTLPNPCSHPYDIPIGGQEQLTISSFGGIKAFKIPSRAFFPSMVLTSISWSIIIYNISIYTLSDLGDLSNLICYLGLFNIIIYTLSDLGDSSNLIGSLFRTVTFYKITKIVRAL